VTVGKGLPPRAQIALVVTGGVLVLALGWLVLLGPKQKHVSDLRKQTSATQAQLTEDLARAAAARAGSTGEQAIKIADVYKLDKAMPSSTDMPDLLLELDQTAKASGVSIDSMGFGPPAPSADGTYSSIQITVQAKGNFYTLTDFLYRLRNLVYVRDGALQARGRIFSVGVFALAPAQKGLSAEITLDTYLYGSANSGAPTLPATPGTTTTTTTTPAASSGPTAAGATP
jgi:type IV pilus assembly protein PilO